MARQAAKKRMAAIVDASFLIAIAHRREAAYAACRDTIGQVRPFAHPDGCVAGSDTYAEPTLWTSYHAPICGPNARPNLRLNRSLAAIWRGLSNCWSSTLTPGSISRIVQLSPSLSGGN